MSGAGEGEEDEDVSVHMHSSGAWLLVVAAGSKHRDVGIKEFFIYVPPTGLQRHLPWSQRT